MHELILMVIIIAIGIVIIMQLNVLSSLKESMSAYREALFMDYQFDENEESYQRIISYPTWNESETLEQLNSYLRVNNHVVPNFEVIKDIIERHTLAQEERIRVLLPIPLYYGLCGTILGIILGIVPLAASSSENPLSDFPMLLSGVAIAMIGSFVGVMITSWANKSYKDASFKHEQCKNALYNFIQVELFPIMNDNPAGPTAQLVRAMADFTEDFTKSAETMQEASETIAETFDSQREVLELAKQLSDSGLSARNLEMAKELSQYVSVVSSFNHSISGMEAYVERLNEATKELQSSTEYIASLEKLTSILSVESDAIGKAVSCQKTNLERSINGIQVVVNKSMDVIEEQQRLMLAHFQKAMNDSLVKFESYLQENQTIPGAVQSLSESTQKLTILPEILERLSDRLDAMQQVQEDQTRAIQELSRVQAKVASSSRSKQRDKGEDFTPSIPKIEAISAPSLNDTAEVQEVDKERKNWIARVLNAILNR